MIPPKDRTEMVSRMLRTVDICLESAASKQLTGDRWRGMEIIRKAHEAVAECSKGYDGDSSGLTLLLCEAIDGTAEMGTWEPAIYAPVKMLLLTLVEYMTGTSRPHFDAMDRKIGALVDRLEITLAVVSKPRPETEAAALIAARDERLRRASSTFTLFLTSDKVHDILKNDGIDLALVRACSDAICNAEHALRKGGDAQWQGHILGAIRSTLIGFVKTDGTDPLLAAYAMMALKVAEDALKAVSTAGLEALEQDHMTALTHLHEWPQFGLVKFA